MSDRGGYGAPPNLPHIEGKPCSKYRACTDLGLQESLAPYRSTCESLLTFGFEIWFRTFCSKDRTRTWLGLIRFQRKLSLGEVKFMTHEEMILGCLRDGLDGEKVDYEWEKSEDQSLVLKFEDGKRLRVTIQELT
jgi:hypothetical protein